MPTKNLPDRIDECLARTGVTCSPPGTTKPGFFGRSAANTSSPEERWTYAGLGHRCDPYDRAVSELALREFAHAELPGHIREVADMEYDGHGFAYLLMSSTMVRLWEMWLDERDAYSDPGVPTLETGVAVSALEPWNDYLRSVRGRLDLVLSEEVRERRPTNRYSSIITKGQRLDHVLEKLNSLIGDIDVFLAGKAS